MPLTYDILHPAIGARVHLDRATIRDAATGQELLALLERHTVLVLPGIGFSDEEQLALTDTLGGRLNLAARIAGLKHADEVFQLSFNEGTRIEKEYVQGTFFWHMDGLTVDVPPPKATILSARKLAATGGQTEFANTKAAYAALPESEKAALQKLHVLHTVTASLREIMPEDSVDPARRVLRRKNPLVWTRANGAQSLVIGSTADLVDGMNQAESRALLTRLVEWTVQPAFSYLHEWTEGDCVIWDNTAALHRVRPYPETSGRLMHRTTIAGQESIS